MTDMTLFSPFFLEIFLTGENPKRASCSSYLSSLPNQEPDLSGAHPSRRSGGWGPRAACTRKPAWPEGRQALG